MESKEKIKLSDIKINPKNPRLIRDKKFQSLVESIKRDPEFLEKRGIVHANGIILGGNQRYMAIKEALKDNVFRESLGLEENTIPVSWVQDASDWPEAKRQRFVIVDNGQWGEWDFDILANEWDDLPLADWGIDLPEDWLTSDTGKDEQEINDTYTNKIIVPIYEPKGEKPTIKELIDRDKTKQLIAEIDNAGLPKDITEFLKLAAERHTAFHFRKIAEFYCHSDIKIQELMEKSGLVIIDFKKAIEYGFVNLTEQLGKLADIEESEDDV